MSTELLSSYQNSLSYKTERERAITMCTFLNDHIPTVLGEPHWWYNGQNACLEWSRSWDRAPFGSN